MYNKITHIFTKITPERSPTMRDFCDLHTHSNFSDGTATPTEVIENAALLRLSAVALTDHNTIAGIPEFLSAAQKHNATSPHVLEAIPGVEISTAHNHKELHIVGLFLQPEYFSTLTDFLEPFNRQKEESNRSLVERLNKGGYHINYDDIVEKQQGSINRAVIASELAKKGYIPNVKEAFKWLLNPAAGYYVPPKRLPSLEAISFLTSIHAIPVLAHPFSDLSEPELRAFLPEAKKSGLAAMETRYANYTKEISATATKIVDEFGLLQSGGSDYHAKNKPDIYLGIGKGSLKVPYSFVTKLKEHMK